MDKFLEKSEVLIKNAQSRDTGNHGHKTWDTEITNKISSTDPTKKPSVNPSAC